MAHKLNPVSYSLPCSGLSRAYKLALRAHFHQIELTGAASENHLYTNFPIVPPDLKQEKVGQEIISLV